MDTLDEMVSQVIDENRQLAKVTARAPAAADGTAEQMLRSLHHEVQRRRTSRRRTSTGE